MSGNEATRPVAVVTGGSTGIGRAVCAALAEKGTRVGVVYNSSEAGAREVAEGLDDAFVARADISDPAGVCGPRRPDSAAAPPATTAQPAASPIPPGTAAYAIDAERSVVTLRVYRSGRLAKLGQPRHHVGQRDWIRVDEWCTRDFRVRGAGGGGRARGG